MSKRFAYFIAYELIEGPSRHVGWIERIQDHRWRIGDAADAARLIRETESLPRNPIITFFREIEIEIDIDGAHAGDDAARPTEDATP